MKSQKWLSAAVFFLFGMTALNGVAVWQLRDLIFAGYGDFATFYTAGTILQHGQGTHLYDLHLQWQVQQEFAPAVKIRQGALPYFHPPFEALAFLPLTYLSYPHACVVWLALKVCILLFIPFLLAPYVPGRPLLPAPVLGVLCLSFFPVAADLLQGQDSILLLLAFVLAFRALRRTRNFKAGVYLALGLIKFHLALPVALAFLLMKRTRMFLGFVSAAALLCFISAAVVGWRGVWEYPKYVLRLNQTLGAVLVKPEIMPNLRGVIESVFHRAPVGSVCHRHHSWHRLGGLDLPRRRL